MPIDAEWRRLWTNVIRRMQADGQLVDETSFFAENYANTATTPALESGPRPIAELPERAKTFIRVKDAQSAVFNIRGILGRANQDVDRIFGNFDQLGERLRQGRYTLEDITAIRSALNVSEGMISRSGNPEDYAILRNIISVREYLDEIEAEFNVERQTDLDIIYDVLNDMRKFQTLGFLNKETRQQAFGLLGNMARRVREGNLLTPTEYDLLADTIKQIEKHTLQAIDQSEKTLLSATNSEETKAVITARCEASRTHLREITSTKLRALRSRKVTALGQFEAPPVVPAQPEAQPAQTVPTVEAPVQGVETTNLEVTPLNNPNKPEAPRGTGLNVGDVVDLRGGNFGRVEQDENGQLKIVPINNEAGPAVA